MTLFLYYVTYNFIKGTVRCINWCQPSYFFSDIERSDFLLNTQSSRICRVKMIYKMYKRSFLLVLYHINC